MRPVSKPLTRYSCPRLASQPRVDSKSGTSMRVPLRSRCAGEGGQYGVGREQAAHYVRDRDAHLRRLAAGLARDTHDAAPGLHQEVVAGTVLVRSRSEARDGTVDEIGFVSFKAS